MCPSTVEPGESFGIVGESGSGKSTVLRAICGLAPLQQGSVTLTGAQPGLPKPGSKGFRRQVQMVFQDPYGSLHPRQTVDRILASRWPSMASPTPRRASNKRWPRWGWAKVFASATRTSCQAASVNASRSHVP
jgi:ABC-type dipeptide/oligopeptide/nickel transport system ATPase subunit